MIGASKPRTVDSGYPPAPGRAGACRRMVFARPFPRLTFIGAFLAAAALLLGFSAPAHAQTLVSNTGQTTHGHTACVLGSEPVIELDCAQGFFTGQNTRGYDLSSIQLDTQGAPGSGTLTVTVRAATGSGRPSNAVLYTLTNPSNVGTGLQTFTAPGGARLNRDTQYFVHMTFDGSGTRPRWNLTANDNEDSGKAIGWSIGDHRYTRRSDGTGGWEGDGGVYSTSIQIRVQGNTLAPAAPNLSAAPGETQVALTWDDPANNTITKYQYRWKTGDGAYGNWTDIDGSDASTDSYTVTGLTSGTAYTFAVRAKNVGGTGAAATVTTATLPAAPNLSAASDETDEVTLTWGDPGNNTITRYQVRSKVSDCDDCTYTAWANIAVTDPDAPPTGYTVTGLTSSTAYRFAVRAKNVGGNGAAATVTAATLPAAPTSLLPVPGDGAVTLSWSNPGGDTIARYQVRSKVTDSTYTAWTDIDGSRADTTEHTVTGLTNGTEYTFELRARNISGPGQASTVTATPRAPPAAPANLLATAGDGRVTLSWTNPGDNTIRKYQVRTDGGGNFTDISGSSRTTTTYTVTGLTNGTQYTLWVRAVNASGPGNPADADAIPLWPAPTNLSVTQGEDRKATLTWDDPADITIAKYQVSTDGGVNYTNIIGSSAATTTHEVTGLTNGTAYTLALRAANDLAGGTAAAITATPLWPAPTNLAAEPGDRKTILQWDTGNALITDYRIHWQATSSGATPEILDVPAGSGNTTTTTISTLTNGTEYTFTVRAVDTSGSTAVITGLPSSKIATPAPVPDPPANLSPTARSQEVALTWTDPDDDTITKYQVSIDSGMNFADIEGSSAATTATTVTDLTNGTAYTLAVRAVNDSGEGAAPRVTATPLWPAPTGLAATPDSGRVVLQWDTGDSGIARYAVRTTLTGTLVSDNAHQSGSGNKTTVSVGGLTDGTNYTFTVRAASGTFTNFQITGAASTATATPAVALPAAPTDLTPTAGDGEVLLTWDDPNNLTITKYQVSTDAGSGTKFTDIEGSNAATTAYTVTGLTNGIQYTFKLRAVNASGDGPWATVTTTPIAVPTAPANFAATQGSDGGEVALTWDDPGNVPITGYQYRQKRGNRAFGDWTDIDGSGATTVSHTVTGLSNGRQHTVELRAVNASGEGAASSDTATPLWPAPNLVATPDHGRVHLEWTGVPGAKDYTLKTEGPGVNWTSLPSFSASPSKVAASIGLDPNHPLTNGDEYTFTVWSTTAGGTQTSVKASVKATPAAPPLPAAPTISSATPGDSRVVLKWDDPGNITITKYQVRWKVKDSEDSTYTAPVDITHPNPYASPPTPPTTYTATGLTNGTTYTFEVRAGNGTGEGPASTVDAMPIAIPDAPENLSAAPGDGQVALSWEKPSNDATIGNYNYEVSTDGGDNYSAIPDSDKETTAHTVMGLTNGTEHMFAVRAENDAGKGLAATVTATPIAVPAAPTALSATAGATEVALTWDDPDDDTITGYQVSTDGGETFADISENDTDNTLAYTVTGLTNGTEYTFALRAENASGVGAASTVTAPTLPAAPTGLMGTEGEDRQVTLSWDDPDNNTVSGYQYSTDGGTTFIDIEGSGAATTTHTVTVLSDGTGTRLTNGTAYTFKLRAVNLSGAGAASLETATPLWPAPTGLVAAPGEGQVMLTWDRGDPGIDRYKVNTYYTPINSVDPLLETFLSPGSGDQTTLLIPGLTNRTDYTFTVQAVDTSGDDTVITGRAGSVDATPVPVPAAPANLAAMPANGQAVLTWDDPNDSSITKYQYRQRVSGADFGDWSDIGGSSATTTTYTVTGLTNGSPYGFELRAVNASGDGKASSVGTTPIAVPDAPTISSATPGDGQVVLAWNDPSDRSITEYQVRSKVRSSDDNTYTDWASIPVTDPNAPPTGYIVTGLTNGTEYTFAVRAVNDPGNGPASTVTARPIAPPAAPEISSVGPGYRQVELEWADPNDSTITGYQVSINGDDNFTDIPNSAHRQTNATGYTVPGLKNGTEYTLAVRAMNDAGEGDASAANATPFNNPPTGKRGEVSTYDNESYRFTMKDFAYSDDEVDTLHHVKIASPPVDDEGNDRGTLSLNGAAITSDTLPRQVTPADLEAGNLLYTPPENAHGDPFATFGFKVSDGESDSVVAYAMAIKVVRVYSVRFGAAAYAVEEGGDPVRVTVTLSKQAADALEIPITVTPRGRTVAADYTVTVTDPDVLDPATGTVTLKFEEMGDTTRSFTIEATGQAQQDDNFHDVRVALGFGDLPTDVAKGAPAAATLTIIDAEGAVVQARFRRLNDEILSKHALTLADVTNRAIGARMDEACGKQAAAYTLAGGSTLYDTLRSNAPAIEDGTLTLDDVLAGSSFRLPLAAVNDGMAPGAGGPVVWGRGERQMLESTESAFAWDGTVLTGQIGIDGCPRDDLLTGLALSRSIGEFDYSDGTGSSPVRGDYQSRMTSVHPYLGWTSPQGLGLWATVGYGWGDIEIEDAQVRDGDPDYAVRRSDMTLKTAAAGASGPLMTDESPIAGGTMALELRSEASWAQVEVEGEGDDGLIAQQTVNAWRLRLALEGSHKWTLASGGSLTPSLELGLRHDGGDGITGTGIEIGGGLRYRDPATGLTVEGNGRVLTGQSDYREWGFGGSFRLDPGAEGRGLSFSLLPTWGETSSGVDRLWDQDVAELASDDGTANDNVPQMRLDGELGYGFGALGGQGLLTPYGGFALADEGSRRYRIGGRFEIGSSLDLSLEGERREPANDAAADHAVMLRGQMRF